jgi:hypothetical protein
MMLVMLLEEPNMYMLNNRIKVITIFAAMLITLISCTRREDMVINDNQEKQANEEAPNSLNLEKDSQLDKSTKTSPNNLNQEKDNQTDQSIKVSLKSISQEEYDKWVLPMYDGALDPNGQPLQLPELEKLDYPYVEGMEDKKLQNKVNKTIKNAIFNDEEFLSGPISAVGVETTPLSYFEFPGIIYNNEILSIPILWHWNRPYSYYKAMSVTIDMKTGERLFLEDIIELNEDFTYKLLFEKDFFINIDWLGDGMKELLYHYSGGDEELPSEASKNLLESLRLCDNEKPQVDEFYLTKDGIVLTRYTNNGSPEEINVPLENLQEFLKIKSWKTAESLQVQQ